MTLICDFCKKPIDGDGQVLSLESVKLGDFHPACKLEFIECIKTAGVRKPEPLPPPQPVPQPSPPVQQFLNEHPPKKVKRSFWSGKPKEPKVQTEEELAGAFG